MRITVDTARANKLVREAGYKRSLFEDCPPLMTGEIIAERETVVLVKWDIGHSGVGYTPEAWQLISSAITEEHPAEVS